MTAFEAIVMSTTEHLGVAPFNRSPLPARRQGFTPAVYNMGDDRKLAAAACSLFRVFITEQVGASHHHQPRHAAADQHHTTDQDKQAATWGRQSIPNQPTCVRFVSDVPFDLPFLIGPPAERFE